VAGRRYNSGIALEMHMSDDLYDRVRQGKIRDLIPDDRNANQGTERGDFMLSQSMQKLGAGRSVLLDKNGKLIAGNKTSAKFGEVGLEDVIIVQTNGKQLVAVQRTDLDIDSPEGREMALADNRTGEVNLSWDTDVLAELAAEGVEVGDWFLPDEMAAWDVALPEDGDWNGEG
jgi:hypothetical protein